MRQDRNHKDKPAEVVHYLGRYHLVVCDIFIAMEGDYTRDGRFPGPVWTKEFLEKAAEIINGGEINDLE